MIAEYFVLRIYRSSASNLNDVLGTLEESSSGTCWSFKNDAELHQVIDKVVHSNETKLNDE